MRLLIEAGAEVEKAERHQALPLTAACMHGDVEVARLLLQARADVDRIRIDGTSELLAGRYSLQRPRESRLVAGVWG